MRKFIYMTSRLMGAVMTLLLLSCNDYLDKMPDNRTQLDKPEKIGQILVSAYPTSLACKLQERMSDNVTDSGEEHGGDDEMYLFWTVSSIYQDSPYAIWVDCYSAIASANHALVAIDEYSGGEDLSSYRGEALICRAFAHFVLVNTFSQAYNPLSSESDMGIPYITLPETTVHVNYDRGTVAEVYRMIAADIEAGFPLLDDARYFEPTYHFTKRAAASFASQFYLYYGDYARSIEYADIVLGEDPEKYFRNWDLVTGTSMTEIATNYNSSEEAANLLNIGYASWMGRGYADRICMTWDLIDETLTSKGPWGDRLDRYDTVWGWDQRSYAAPKIPEYFIVTDQVAGTGHGIIIVCYLTVEKTILNRAEAYALQGDYAAAARDLNLFYKQGRGTNNKYDLTAEEIAAWYEKADAKYKKPLAPRFTLQEGMQTNLIHAVLHARRIAALHEGTRLEDIKRYGIAYEHKVDKRSTIHIAPYDKRLAVLIPDAVAAAGITQNPR